MHLLLEGLVMKNGRERNRDSRNAKEKFTSDRPNRVVMTKRSNSALHSLHDRSGTVTLKSRGKDREGVSELVSCQCYTHITQTPCYHWGKSSHCTNTGQCIEEDVGRKWTTKNSNGNHRRHSKQNPSTDAHH